MSAVSQKPYTIEGTRYDQREGVYAIITKDMFQRIKPDDSILFVVEGHPFSKTPPPSYKQPGGIQKVIMFSREKLDQAISLVFKSNQNFLALQEGLAKSQNYKQQLEEFAKLSALNEQIIAQCDKDILNYTAKIAQHDQRIAQHDQRIVQHDQNTSAAQAKIELGRKMQEDAKNTLAQNAARREILLKRMAELEAKKNSNKKTTPASSQPVLAASIAPSKSTA